MDVTKGDGFLLKWQIFIGSQWFIFECMLHISGKWLILLRKIFESNRTLYSSFYLFKVVPKVIREFVF